MSMRILSSKSTYEHDMVAARQRARQLAALLGFDSQDQTVSRQPFRKLRECSCQLRTGGGRIEFQSKGRTAPQVCRPHYRSAGRGTPTKIPCGDGR